MGSDASLPEAKVEVLWLVPGLREPAVFMLSLAAPHVLYIQITMCLLVRKEKHTLPDSVFQFLTMQCKASDSVNIFISLCWEVGIQFTI